MPMYSMRCNECGEHGQFFAKIAERDSTPECCGVPTERLLDTPQISAMAWTGWKGLHMLDGKNGGQGTWIESGAAYKAYIKANNKLVGQEGAREAEIQRANREAADDKRLTAAVERAVLTHRK